jgi:hypothetical protein
MGKMVRVTGTPSGIGRVTVKLFADRGWNVAAVAATIHRFGTNRRSGQRHASYVVFGPLEGISAEQLERQFQTNVLGERGNRPKS